MGVNSIIAYKERKILIKGGYKRMQNNRLPVLALIASLIVGLAAILIISPSKGDVPREALVPPGEYDEYYGFLSGGPGGDVRVIGVPSMRTIRRIPVFEPSMRYGYGVDEEGRYPDAFQYTWGDTHHPVLSKTNGEKDGRWLFINDKGNGQIARISLATFEVEQIAKIPTAQSIHGLTIDPVAGRFLAAAVEFPVPIQQDLSKRGKEEMAGIVILDPAALEVKYQIYAPKKDAQFG
jgi:nitrous-oxide reductase